MKKLFYLLAIAIVALVLPSCGGSGSNSQSSTENKNANLPEQKVVKVSNAQQLVDAIANDTKIIIDSKDWLSWDSQIDIKGISNLTIEGKSPERAHIRINDALSDVFDITKSSNIILKNLKLGHNAPRYECEGFVVSIDESSDVTLDGCDIYGCGLEGVYVGWHNNSNILIDNCDIYECYRVGIDINSYDGFTVENVVVNNTKIHDCGQAVSVWQSEGNIKDVVFQRCDISCYVSSEYGQISANKPVSFIDCKIATADDFYDDYKPFMTFDNCKISRIPRKEAIEYGREDYDEMAADGYYEEYDEEEYEGDSPYPVYFDYDEFVELNESKLKEVKVKNADELRAAIASNTKIIVKSKDAINLGVKGLGIRDIENLVIEADKANTEIVVRDEFEDVLAFYDCKNVVLRGFTLGHDVEPGACDGNVVRVVSCDGVLVENCKMFGCGVVGFYAYDSNNIMVMNSVMYECSDAAASLANCSNVMFGACTFRNCPLGFRAYSESGPIRGVVLENPIFEKLDQIFEVRNWGINVVNAIGIDLEEFCDIYVFLRNDSQE